MKNICLEKKKWNQKISNSNNNSSPIQSSKSHQDSKKVPKIPGDLTEEQKNEIKEAYSSFEVDGITPDELKSAMKTLGFDSNNYERIFIISDMQVMDNRHNWGYWFTGDNSAYVYYKYFGNKVCYSFDLGNYHTQILSPHDHIRYVTSLNDQVFKFIGLLESGINLVDYINKFNYC